MGFASMGAAAPAVLALHVSGCGCEGIGFEVRLTLQLFGPGGTVPSMEAVEEKALAGGGCNGGAEDRRIDDDPWKMDGTWMESGWRLRCGCLSTCACFGFGVCFPRSAGFAPRSVWRIRVWWH